MKFVFDRVENIVEKVENAGYWPFPLLPKGFVLKVVKSPESVLKGQTSCVENIFV